jgi:hypothetical protein
MMRVELYADHQKAVWDDFVQQSNNGTFLFLRDYMDYHRDRFVDHSLLISLRDGEPLSLLPAHRVDDSLVSHGGLTYGGFITDDRMGSVLMLDVFESAVVFARARGIRKLVYKTIPYIYHRLPAEEDRYALLRFGGALARRDVLTVMRPGERARLQDRRVRGVRKAETLGVAVEQSEDYEGFWRILEWNLSTVHQAKPVHSVAEIRRLHAKFPENIKLYAAFLDSELIAGTIIYESQTVARAQYIASSERGRSSQALDLVFYYLLNEVYREKDYFDFGSSTANDGRELNAGLIEFKEGFGARAVMHDFYELQIAL